MERTFIMRRPVPASDHDRSFWIKQLLPDHDSKAPTLDDKITASVAIVGGGLTGLWTAWRILERAPETDIVLLEADFCGSGASGRNGGQVHSWFNHLPSLCTLVGEEAGMELAIASRKVIDELQDLQETSTLSMDLKRGGWLWLATSEAQLGAWNKVVQISRRHGEKPYESMQTEELQQLTGTMSALDGVMERNGGTLNPFLLVRSLRQRLIDRGVRIYERTPVISLTAGRRPILQTPRGTVSAAKVLLASNAWAGSIRELNKYMFAFDAQVITTEPDRRALDSVGLESGRAMGDSQAKVNYWLRTMDDRLLMGRGSGIPIYRDRIGPRSNRNQAHVRDVTTELHRLYPDLAHLEVTHDWMGSVDFTVSRVPLVGWLKREPNIAYCVGWSGTALAQIPVVARILAELMVPRIAGRWARHPLVNSPKHLSVVREPMRYIGSKVVKRAVDRSSDRQALGLAVDPITRRLVELVPKYREFDETKLSTSRFRRIR